MKVAIDPKTESAQEFATLLNFYQSARLDLTSPYEKYKDAAEAFLKQADQRTQHVIIDAAFNIDNTPFKFYAVKSDEEKYHWLFSFQNFFSAINNVISHYQPKSLNDEGAERQYILKRSAFDLVGFNEPVVRPGRKGYGLIYKT